MVEISDRFFSNFVQKFSIKGVISKVRTSRTNERTFIWEGGGQDPIRCAIVKKKKKARPSTDRAAALAVIISGGAVANRLRRRTSDQTVLGSNPAVAAALSPWTRLFTPIVPRRSLHISFY